MATATSERGDESIAKKQKMEANPLSQGVSIGSYPTSDKFLRILISTKVDVVRPPNNTIFVAQRTDLITEVWKGMVTHGFLSVPVLQKTKNKYYGFVDMYDIVKFVIEFFGETEDLKADQDWFKMASLHEEFKKKTVNDVMRYPLTRRNPFFPVKSGFSLFASVEAMARERGLHRVPVIGEDRQLITVVTQSQIVKLVAGSLDIIGERKNKPVILTDRYIEDVYTVHQDSLAIDAFRMMAEKNVSGLAVIDDDGKLVGALSVRDLKTMSTDGRMFWRLFQTIKNFILKVRRENNEKDGDRPRTVVTVKAFDTLESVIKKLAEHNIHRIFIVDDHKKPVGVISLKDVLLELLT